MGDEVYSEPKGAICISLFNDVDTGDIGAQTHRLNDEEWETFRTLELTEGEVEDANIYLAALPAPLTTGIAANQDNFQTAGCDIDNTLHSITCRVWQPNEIPTLGATDRFPRFSAGNIAWIAWADVEADVNDEKL